MSLMQVVNNGWQAPKVKAGPGSAQRAYRYNASVARFCTLTELVVTRTSKIRAAHRRWLRQRGLPLTPLVPSRKYRASKRVNSYMLLHGMA